MAEEANQFKKKAPKGRQAEEPPVESLHLSVNYFFREVGGLLSSVARLFNLETGSLLQVEGRSDPDMEQVQCPISKGQLFKKHSLTRKLEKMLLEQDDKKYPQLLDLFGEYYRCK